LAKESRFGQRLGKDHSWGGDDPARNIPDLLDDACHERCFRQRHQEEYRDAENWSISPGYLIGTEQFLDEVWPVRDDPIHLTGGDSLDFFWLIDRPCVHLVSSLMERANDAARDEMAMEHDFIRAAPSHSDEQWKGADRAEDFPRDPASIFKRPTGWTMTGGKSDWHLGKRRSQPLNRTRIGAGNVCVIRKLVAVDGCNEFGLESRDLHIEKQWNSAIDDLNCLVECDESRENAFQQLDWRSCRLMDQPIIISVLQIMHQYELPIAGGHQIELDPVDAKPESSQKRVAGIARVKRSGSTMPDDFERR
jgi:hypothetical protein